MKRNIKQQAFDLQAKGLSYRQIATSLKISKTMAFNHVKEVKTLLQGSALSMVQQHSEPVQNVLTGEHSVIMKPNELVENNFQEFTGDDLLHHEFDCLEFEGKFSELIGQPSRIFSGIIWGLPKGGKSNLALRFADYLQEYFGDVVYISAEEGFSQTLKEKFLQLGGSKVTVTSLREKAQIVSYLEKRNFQFVFIDSINVAGIDNEGLEKIKLAHPTKSFISIVQATKGGNFKGDQGLTHNCDFIIKVANGIAFHTGRFNTASEMEIFETAWYTKNPKPRITYKEPEKSIPLPKASEEISEKTQIPEGLTNSISVSREPNEPLQIKTPAKIGLFSGIKNSAPQVQSDPYYTLSQLSRKEASTLAKWTLGFISLFYFTEFIRKNNS